MTQTIETEHCVPWSLTYAVEALVTPDITMSGGTGTSTGTGYQTDDLNVDDYQPDDPGPPFPPNP
jgi:hypothetical protein